MQVFEPNLLGNNTTLWISLGLMVLGFVLTFMFFKKYKTLALLTFFVGIIATCSTIFSFWSQQKLIPVELDATKLVTPYGETQLSEIKAAYIRGENEKSTIIREDDTKLLIIVERTNKTHVLSELNYPVDTIKALLDAYLLPKNAKED